MLTELTHVSQRQGEPKRRWFQSSDEDLIVWYTDDGSILGFQLCYDIRRGERALTWLSGRGYSHERVDDGEVVGLGHKRTPVLVPDGAFAVDDVLRRFLSISDGLPSDVTSFVERKIREYPKGGKET